ncbi:MAG: response regulator receiver protein [Myxococcales bacterium]|nr:response regulator receiver protein [Myxococcales bacterium]
MGSILLVEADPVTCDQWATAVSAAGHAVLSATALREALPLIRDGGIDVVVIDAYDPRHGLIELARSIEALPDAPPIILVSGSPAAPEISVRIGVAAFIPKPCEPSEIVTVVNRLIGALRPVRAFEDEPTGMRRPRL